MLQEMHGAGVRRQRVVVVGEMRFVDMSSSRYPRLRPLSTPQCDVGGRAHLAGLDRTPRRYLAILHFHFVQYVARRQRLEKEGSPSWAKRLTRLWHERT